MAWRLSLGNLISRAPETGIASDSWEDPLYPMSDIGNGQPQDPTRWLWESDGTYGAAFDLNLLAKTSARADAPSGWRDLANTLAGTPGIGADPPEWGTFQGRANTLKFYAPVFQDIDVLPGEDLLFVGGLYVETASDATGVRVIVLNLTTGEQWDGVADEWNNSTDPLAEQTTLDAWLNVNEAITNASTERVTYRVILAPIGTPGPTCYVYASDPGVTAEQDFVSLIGHSIPEGSTVTWSDGVLVTRTITLEHPSCYSTGTASSERYWTLSITIPANTKAWTAAPYIGELWAGRLVDLVACPGYPFDILEGDISQVRLEGGLGRESVYTEMERPNRLFTMKFKASEDAYYDTRDNFLRACRYGADPVMLAPVETVETPAIVWHGRVGPEATFSLINRTRRTFEIKLRESPWPRFR